MIGRALVIIGNAGPEEHRVAGQDEEAHAFGRPFVDIFRVSRRRCPGVLPRFSAALTVEPIALSSFFWPAGPTASIETEERSPGPTKATSTPSVAAMASALASPSAVSTL